MFLCANSMFLCNKIIFIFCKIVPKRRGKDKNDDNNNNIDINTRQKYSKPKWNT